RIVANGHLHRGYKPVHWCLDCRSALAEAEVEYIDKTSTAIDVGFVVLDSVELHRRAGLNGSAPVMVPIWTTTAWTLPANQAVAVGAELEYRLIEAELGNGPVRLVLATELAEAALSRYGAQTSATLAVFSGQVLEG